MATQVNHGAGFEYCCALSLLEQYRQNHLDLFVDQQSIPGFHLRQRRFKDVKPDIANQQLRAAKAVAHHVTTSNERWAKNIFDAKRSYKMRIGDDARNMDVRDLVIYANDIPEFGISLKWNSEEIKSLRLGDNWFKKFHILDQGEWDSQVRNLHKTLLGYETWREAIASIGAEKLFGTYRAAVVDAINRGIGEPGFMQSFSQFLFGKQDYLKVMAIAKGKDISLAYYDSDKLPTKIYSAHENKRGPHYFEIVFDKGWTLLFRLHNKDSKIKSDAVGSGMSLTITVTGWGERSGQRCWRVPDDN